MGLAAATGIGKSELHTPPIVSGSGGWVTRAAGGMASRARGNRVKTAALRFDSTSRPPAERAGADLCPGPSPAESIGVVAASAVSAAFVSRNFDLQGHETIATGDRSEIRFQGGCFAPPDLRI